MNVFLSAVSQLTSAQMKRFSISNVNYCQCFDWLLQSLQSGLRRRLPNCMYTWPLQVIDFFWIHQGKSPSLYREKVTSTIFWSPQLQPFVRMMHKVWFLLLKLVSPFRKPIIQHFWCISNAWSLLVALGLHICPQRSSLVAVECSQISFLKKETNLTKEEAPQWDFKKTYLIAFLGHTDATETT